MSDGSANLVPQDENPSSEGGSVFIYSPFASDKPEIVTKWCRGELNSILITFRNPLDAPLAIKQANLIIEGTVLKKYYTFFANIV